MQKLIMCVGLLILASVTKSWAELADVVPMLSDEQNGHVKISGQTLNNKKTNEIPPGPAYINGVLWEHHDKRRFYKTCNVRKTLHKDAVYLIYLKDIKGDLINCAIDIDIIWPDSPRAKQFKSR